jgi:hypothetical protein
MTDAIPEAEAAVLATQQLTHLMTGGHRNTKLCHVQVVPGHWRSADQMCQRWATHRVEQLSYRYGMITGGLFHPALTLSRVCAEHGEALRGEPGLVALMALNCPPELIELPGAEVYRDRQPGRCGWIDCPEIPDHGRFCDPHRRWHGQRLLRQLSLAQGGVAR